MNKTVFWNVDTQVDFIESDGKLAVPNATDIKPNLKKLTDYAESKGVIVVNTMDWHHKDSKELSENPDFIKTFPPHCMAYTSGAEFIPETSPRSQPFYVNWEAEYIRFPEIHNHRNIVIRKDAFDVFEGNKFTESIVSNLGVPMKDRPEFVVYGVATNVCVNAAVRGLLRRGYKVTVVIDAIKELPNIPSPVTEWEKEGAILVSTETIISK